MTEPEALRIAFHRGEDSTHNPRDLPLGFGTRCWDIDLRSGIYEPRPGPERFRHSDTGNQFYIRRYPPLFMPVSLPSGKVALLAVEPEESGAGTYNAAVFYKTVHFENEPNGTTQNDPWLGDRMVVQNRESHWPHACQVVEPCEAAAYGDKLYVCNLNDPRWSAYATAEIDLRDLKASHEVISTWPKARHICMSPDGYPIFLDVYARGPLSVETSDQPLSFTGEPTFGTNYDEIPGAAGDRNMRGIFHQNGLFIFQKRSVFVLWGPPPEWDHELVLNNIGTLSPSSVVSIGQYIYFLGNDGIVKRMTGEKGVVENVGAYTPDGRSPIENALKGYYTKPSGEAGTLLYNNAALWNTCTQDPVGGVVVTDDGVRLPQLAQVAGESCFGGYGAIISIPSDGIGVYQTFATPDSTDPGYNATYGHGFLLHSAKFIFAPVAGSPTTGYSARLRVSLNVAGGNEEQDVIGEVTVNFDLPDPSVNEVTFTFDEPILIDQEPTVPVTVRLMLDQTGGPGELLSYMATAPYTRGAFNGGAGDMVFFTYFTGYAVDTDGTIGREDTVADARWKIGNIVSDLPEGVTAVLQCFVTGQGWLDIPDGGALLTDPGTPTKVHWRVKLRTTYYNHTPLVRAVALHYAVGGNAGDEPFAVDWDGRYCLSLLRREVDPAAVVFKRDLFVWDNEAWSIWRAPRTADASGYESVGFHRLAVFPDDQNRQRLVFYDPEQAASDYGYITCLLRDYYSSQSNPGWRVPVPQFISREMLIAGGLAGKVKQSYLRCTDLGMTGRLWMGLSFDGMAWANGPDFLSRDMVIPPGVLNHEHLFTERPYPNEGRFCKAFIGYLDELPRQAGGGIVNALVKVQDWLLVPRAISFREGFHSGGTDA